MRKIIYKTFTLFVTLLLLTSCGEEKEISEHIGLYSATSIEIEGVNIGVGINDWIKLEENEVIEVSMFGEVYGGKWSLHENQFTFTQDEDSYNGTLEDETLVVDYDGLIYTYQKGEPKAQNPIEKDNTEDNIEEYK